MYVLMRLKFFFPMLTGLYYNYHVLIKHHLLFDVPQYCMNYEKIAMVNNVCFMWGREGPAKKSFLFSSNYT